MPWVIGFVARGEAHRRTDVQTERTTDARRTKRTHTQGETAGPRQGRCPERRRLLPPQTMVKAAKPPPPGAPVWWASAREGRLAPWAQAQVWAAVTFAERHGLTLSDGDIAGEIRKVGGGHPTKQAVAALREAFASDPAWHPGKGVGEAKTPGPRPRFTAAKKAQVAASAMVLKAAGMEPTAELVVARCPKAAENPDTGAPFTPKYVYQVFRSQCFDAGSGEPWDHANPLQKTALPEDVKEWRRYTGPRNNTPGHPPL